jgi:hypothetical protein
VGDFDSWTPEEPPPDFAERVVARVRFEQARRRRVRALRLGGGLVGALSVAAAALLVVGREPVLDRGELHAGAREEVRLAGGRAVLVLEAGAHLSWNGKEVRQAAGDVFYRVERSADDRTPFRVHTAAGDVTVKGTCFRVKVAGHEEDDSMSRRDVVAAGIGAGMSTMVFVGVYEGKVLASHGASSVDVAAGESARLDGAGVHRTGDIASGEQAFARTAAEEGSRNDDVMAANASLARTVQVYKDRLAANEAEKQKIAEQLQRAQERLTAASTEAGVALRAEYEFTTDDYAQMAKEGSLKYQLPCDGPLDAERQGELGLSPEDATVVQRAGDRSKQRVWGSVKPLCVQAVGSPEVADKLGDDTCVHLIQQIERGKPGVDVAAEIRRVDEMRAGIRPMPGPNDDIAPVEKLFLALTGEMTIYEHDLAQSLGPDEAHRIAFGDTCANRSSWTTSGSPPKP